MGAPNRGPLASVVEDIRGSKACESCVFWCRDPETLKSFQMGDKYGLCQRRAPSVPPHPQAPPWPSTMAHEWCGEHVG